MIKERGFAAAQCPSILPEVSGYHLGDMSGKDYFLSPPLCTYLEVSVECVHLVIVLNSNDKLFEMFKTCLACSLAFCTLHKNKVKLKFGVSEDLDAILWLCDTTD